MWLRPLLNSRTYGRPAFQKTDFFAYRFQGFTKDDAGISPLIRDFDAPDLHGRAADGQHDAFLRAFGGQFARIITFQFRLSGLAAAIRVVAGDQGQRALRLRSFDQLTIGGVLLVVVLESHRVALNLVAGDDKSDGLQFAIAVQVLPGNAKDAHGEVPEIEVVRRGDRPAGLKIFAHEKGKDFKFEILNFELRLLPRPAQISGCQ